MLEKKNRRLLYRPVLLKPGDSVRIVAPSGPVDREQLDRGITCLEHEFGLHALVDEGVFARDAYLAGSDQRRLSEFNQALEDDDIKAIWFARGGYGATRLLPSIQQQLIAQRQPWLIGFSDATALHALWQKTGLQSVHAAGVTSLPHWSAEACRLLRDYLFQGEVPSLQGITTSGDTVVQGPLMGGNLTVFAALAGTGYLPDLTGSIVFLEDVGERPYRLDRSLTQLCQAGAFEGVLGFAIGQLTSCHDPKNYGRDALTAICNVLEPLRVPLITQLPVGHESSSFALPLGKTAVLDANSGTLSFV